MRPRLRRLLQPALARLDRYQREVLEIRSGDPLAARFAEFGDGSLVGWPPAELGNTASVALGRRVVVRSGVCFEALAPPGTVVIRVGDRTHVGYGVRFVAVNGIDVGRDCGIGHGTTLADTIHDYKTAGPERPAPQAELKLGRPLHIGDGVWIGNGCVVAGGISIGEGSIIGPNCFVNRDVPAGSLVAGGPARRQRRRRPDGTWEWLVDPASVELDG